MNNETCPTCGKPYGQRKRCYQCKGRPRTGEVRNCKQCGQSFYAPGWVRQGQGLYCSRSCHYAAMHSRAIQAGPTLKRRVRPDGYVEVHVGKSYPGASSRGLILEHRKVMAEILGRTLGRFEHVHHKDEDRSNNDPPNLRVMGASAHNAMHGGTEAFQARYSGQRETKPCEFCGQPFTRPKFREGRFCGRSCRTKAMWAAKRLSQGG